MISLICIALGFVVGVIFRVALDEKKPRIAPTLLLVAAVIPVFSIASTVYLSLVEDPVFGEFMTISEFLIVVAIASVTLAVSACGIILLRLVREIQKNRE